ncbi:MAG: hypothetical protein ACFFBP_05930 [Promethearchaeota archaeon]
MPKKKNKIPICVDPNCYSSINNNSTYENTNKLSPLQFNKKREEQDIKSSFSIRNTLNKDYVNQVFFAVKKIISSNSIIIHHKEQEVIRKVKKILNDALKKGLTYQDLRPSRNPCFFALTLCYYALLLLGVRKYNHNKINARMILRNSKLDSKKIGLYSITFPDQEELILNINRTETAYFFNFLSIEDQKNIPDSFKPKIRKDVKERLNNFENLLIKSIKEYSKLFQYSEFISDMAISIYNDGIQGNKKFKPSLLPKGFRGAENLAITLLFYSIKHKSYPINTFKRGYLIKDFFNNFFNKKDSSLVRQLLPIFYKFLSDNLKDKIYYRPIQRNVHLSKEKFEIHLKKMLMKFSNIFNLKNLTSYALSLYNKAVRNGFTYLDLSIQNPTHLASALIYFITNDNQKIKKLSIRNITDKLREIGYSVDEKYLNDIIDKIYYYISTSISMPHKQFIKRDIFINELEKIKTTHKSYNRIINFLLLKFILLLFKSFKGNPSLFIEKLGIERDPQALIRTLKFNNIYVKVNVLEKVIIAFREFIYNEIDDFEQQKNLNELLEEYYYEKQQSRTETQKKRNLKARERISNYGNYYKSTKIRIKRFILMLGFSPYDGYDLWKNKTKYKDKFRIWANFHHIHYNSNDESQDDLIFLPLVHPDDIGKDYYYLTHNKVSNFESILVKEDISDQIKSMTQIKLENIKNRIIKNSNIILNAIITINPEILNDLKGWDKSSIIMAKKRLIDTEFLWIAGIEQYIPAYYKHKKIDINNIMNIIDEIQQMRIN